MGKGKRSGPGELAVPTLQMGVANLMESHEAHVGTSVRVKEGNRRRSLCGMFGTVENRWGDPTYPALDVRLEGGQKVLFWFHELDLIQGPDPIPV